MYCHVNTMWRLPDFAARLLKLLTRSGLVTDELIMRLWEPLKIQFSKAGKARIKNCAAAYA
jgi:hypothetical protein